MFPFLLVGERAIQVVSSISDSGAVTGAPTLDVSGMDLQENDVLVVVFGCTGVDETFGMTGFVNVADIYETDDYDTNLHVGYKVQTSSPDSSVTVGPALASTQPYTVIAFNFRGVDTSNVLDVAAVTNTNGSTLNIDPGAITPVTGEYIILAGGASATDAATTYTSSSLTDIVSVSQGVSGTFSNAAAGFSYTETNPAQFASSLASDNIYSSCEFIIALRPA